MTRELLFLMTAAQAQGFADRMRAAESGDGAAACELGDLYRVGAGGLRHSPAQTFRWYARSALAGDANGQNNLGACYEHGIGCKQGYRNAVSWYRKAAAQQLAYASSNLGYCYLHGHGVRADKTLALTWFERALEQGDKRAADMVKQLGGKVRSTQSASDGAGVQVRFTDATEAGRNLGIVGVGGAAPPHEAVDADEEYLQIYAESGMKPVDLVGETARKYAEYLEKDKKKG
jgi:TPR repeat protein